ncbi:MAG: ATP-binding protein [Candidatus Eremiobacteraeota bacterium]|nr:ATP-binding protein [Candidatus Eremiobacteraeota bacterium]
MDLHTAEWSFHSANAREAISARKSFRHHLRSIGAGEEQCMAGELIFGELLANVVRHAPGPVWIWLECVGADCMLHVVDCGGRPWSYHVPVSASALADHGRGLLIAQAYAKRITFNRNADSHGTHVTAYLDLQLHQSQRLRA